MLRLTIPSIDLYDEENEQFIVTKEQTIQLEHSLLSLSKWESKWHKPFLGKEEKTNEELIDYVRCMMITQNVSPLIYSMLGPNEIQKINAYIDDPMTATWFSNRDNKKTSSDVITAEIIYYWMISLQIPFECEKWHLNRLLTLIRVCNEKNTPKQKMSKRDLLNSNRVRNAERKRRLNSRG